jgi:hypothetical protein
MGKEKWLAGLGIGLLLVGLAMLLIQSQRTPEMPQPGDSISGNSTTEHESNGAIGIIFAINARAGPERNYMYVAPDGQGFIYLSRRGYSDAFANPEETIAKLRQNSDVRSFTFVDPTVYERVLELLAPLRQITGETGSPDEPGLAGKTVIECERPKGHHASHLIAWIPTDERADFSFFDHSGPYNDCPQMREAHARLIEAEQIFTTANPNRPPQR